MLEAQSDQLQMWDGKNSKIWAGVQTFLVMFCSAPAVARTAGAPFRPTNMFAPASTPAQSIFGLSIFVAVTGAIFIVVFTLLADSVVEFRKPKNDDGREPPRSTAAIRLKSPGPLSPFSSLWRCSWQQRA